MYRICARLVEPDDNSNLIQARMTLNVAGQREFPRNPTEDR